MSSEISSTVKHLFATWGAEYDVKGERPPTLSPFSSDTLHKPSLLLNGTVPAAKINSILSHPRERIFPRPLTFIFRRFLLMNYCRASSPLPVLSSA